MESESWRLLGKEELAHQYSPSQWSQRMDKDAVIEAHVRETTEGTRKSRAMAKIVLNIKYGYRNSEKLDMYLPQEHTTDENNEGAKGFPLLVYIHGGYWQFLSKEESGFMVPPLVSQGIAVMVADYDIAPKGDMDLMVSQVRQSIVVTLTKYPQITGVYLCGHSAGAHLVAMTLCTDWSEYSVTPKIEGAVLVSGIYDLIPIIHTYVNDALKMSESVAQRNSPMQCVAQIKRHADTCQMAIVVAEHDSPEFHRQSMEYFQGLCPAEFVSCGPAGNSHVLLHGQEIPRLIEVKTQGKNSQRLLEFSGHSKSLQAMGLNVSFTQIDGTDHFDVIEKLYQEQYLLTQMILNMITKK